MKHQTRHHRLTPEEAAKYRAVREQVEQEKPQIKQRIGRKIAEKQATRQNQDRFQR